MTDKKLPNNNEENKEEHFTSHDLFRKHMADEHHQITDEDLKKIDIDAEVEDEIKQADDELDQIEENEEKKKDFPNPYDIIGE